jgi:hypothetical protein
MLADVLEAEAAAGDAPAREPRHGLLDYYGYHTPSGAWCFVGWIEQGHVAPDRPTTVDLRIDFDSGTVSGPGIVTYFYRPDLGGRGTGGVVALPVLWARYGAASLAGACLFRPLCRADRSGRVPAPARRRCRRKAALRAEQCRGREREPDHAVRPAAA